jgi:Cdc6-like AAA superfamily ATPase
MQKLSQEDEFRSALALKTKITRLLDKTNKFSHLLSQLITLGGSTETSVNFTTLEIILQTPHQKPIVLPQANLGEILSVLDMFIEIQSKDIARYGKYHKDILAEFKQISLEY